MNKNSSQQTFCYKCMSETVEQICPYCEFDNGTLQTKDFLPYAIVLSDKYMIGRMIDANGDGCSYIAYDLSQNEKVIIREFFPQDLCCRMYDQKSVAILRDCDVEYLSYISKFKTMWRNIAKMKHLSCLFPVYDIFEENNTVYVVSEHINFVTLEKYLNDSPSQTLTWDQAKMLFMPTLSTLEALHTAGIIHGGISPENLLVCEDKRLRLFGFSIPQVRAEKSNITPQLFDGYSAIEQYTFNVNLTPTTDIYAFASCILNAITGVKIPCAKERAIEDKLMISSKIVQNTPTYVLVALANAMKILPSERTPNAEEFRAEISASPTVLVKQENLNLDVPPENFVPNYQPPLQEIQQNQSINKQSKPQKISISKIIIPVLIILISVLGIGALAKYIFIDNNSNILNHETYTTLKIERLKVPNLLEKNRQAIENDLKLNEDFNVIIIEEFNNSIIAGIAFEQTPSPDFEIEKGQNITVKISKGPEKIELIDVTDFDINDAILKLEELGFVTKTIEKYNDGSHEKGLVAGTNLKVGQEYNKETEIIVFVWSNPPQLRNVEEVSDEIF